MKKYLGGILAALLSCAVILGVTGNIESFTAEAQEQKEEAQRPLGAGEFIGTNRKFTAQTATGATSTLALSGVVAQHTVHLVTTGSPTGCTYRLQGSVDNSVWFNISDADITCTSTITTFYANRPSLRIRGNLLTLSGGTAPTVTLHYAGR